MILETVRIDENTWRFEENGMVRFFLLTGSEKALLIDGGMQSASPANMATNLTDLPIYHLLTHADPDHMGAAHQFKEFYMHPSEASNFYNTQGRTGKFTAIREGDVIELGDRPLEVVHLPGHTPGSIGLIDINNRVLFCGDVVQDGAIFMFGVQREIHAYCQTLEHLLAIKDRFDLIYPSHGTLPLEPDFIDKLYEETKKVMNDEYPKFDVDLHGMKAKMVDVGIAKFMVE